MYWIYPYFVPLTLVVGIIILLALDARIDYRNKVTRVSRDLRRYGQEEELPAHIEQQKRSALKWFAKNACLAFVVCNVVLLVLSFMAAPDSTKRYGNYETAASEFGLQANKEYPLAIGGTLYGGSDGSVTNYGYGFFSASSVSDLRPATSVNLSFSHDDKSWITTISTEIITFHIDNDNAASMSVEFANTAYGTLNTWDNETTNSVALSNGALGYVRQFVNPDISMTEAGIHDGLAPVVNQGVSHVDITVPQNLYDEIVNLR